MSKQQTKRLINGKKVHKHCRNVDFTQNEYRLPIIFCDNQELLVIDKPHDIVLTLNNLKDDEWNVLSLLTRDHSHMIDGFDDSLHRQLPPSDDDTDAGTVTVAPVKKSFKFCHQIDFETSGLCVIAVTKDAASSIAKAFMNRQVEKYYVMTVYGHLEKSRVKQMKFEEQMWSEEDVIEDERNDRLTIRTFVKHSNGVFKGRMRHVPPSDPLSKDSSRTAEAVSRFKVLAYGKYQDQDVTLLGARILTGRRHQLRLQCAYMGHPIIGDTVHCSDKSLAFKADRTMLHSYCMKIHAQGTSKNIQSGDELNFITQGNPLEQYIESRVDLMESRNPCDWSL